ncbi:hypothetical protein FGIG_03391 [Fasciola gigantica]|uniref:Uncharacterized protein n=1 Tax=Fasciola gigantica TaxID=46835 RepID=A0A504Z0N3_FASGI|nr:hypothetical protein FGIG_03391 [Fasciola gigantica]
MNTRQPSFKNSTNPHWIHLALMEKLLQPVVYALFGEAKWSLFIELTIPTLEDPYWSSIHADELLERHRFISLFHTTFYETKTLLCTFGERELKVELRAASPIVSQAPEAQNTTTAHLSTSLSNTVSTTTTTAAARITSTATTTTTPRVLSLERSSNHHPTGQRFVFDMQQHSSTSSNSSATNGGIDGLYQPRRHQLMFAKNNVLRSPVDKTTENEVIPLNSHGWHSSVSTNFSSFQDFTVHRYYITNLPEHRFEGYGIYTLSFRLLWSLDCFCCYGWYSVSANSNSGRIRQTSMNFLRLQWIGLGTERENGTDDGNCAKTILVNLDVTFTVVSLDDMMSAGNHSASGGSLSFDRQIQPCLSSDASPGPPNPFQRLIHFCSIKPNRFTAVQSISGENPTNWTTEDGEATKEDPVAKPSGAAGDVCLNDDNDQKLKEPEISPDYRPSSELVFKLVRNENSPDPFLDKPADSESLEPTGPLRGSGSATEIVSSIDSLSDALDAIKRELMAKAFYTCEFQ